MNLTRFFVVVSLKFVVVIVVEGSVDFVVMLTVVNFVVVNFVVGFVVVVVLVVSGLPVKVRNKSESRPELSFVTLVGWVSFGVVTKIGNFGYSIEGITVTFTSSSSSLKE